MGVFDNGKVKENSKNISSLERKNKKLEETIKELSHKINELERGLPDIVKTHKGQAIQLGRLKNSIESKAVEALDSSKNIKGMESELSKILDEVKEGKIIFESTLQESSENLTSLKSKIELALAESDNKVSSVSQGADNLAMKMSKLTSLTDQYPNLGEELEDIESKLNETKELSQKGKALHAEIRERKDEIDALYFEIIGYSEIEEDSGEEVVVEGLKGKLQRQYEDLKKNLQQLGKDVEGSLESSKSQTEEVIESWKSKYIEIESQIKGLLPAALTAGLSSAYSDKRKEETDTYKYTQKLFYRGIIALVGASLIPLAVSLIFIYNGVTLDMVIERAPRVVVAILPLYIPALWLAYSANKQLNLSKRLIEEYTHKEVQSRTYEGLSSQINSLDNSDEAIDLKIRLLQNVLTISSENPGKLISDYNKTDHPIMDVLEKSLRYEQALERTEKIPGLNKLLNSLKERTIKEAEKQGKKIDRVLTNKLDNGIDKAIEENI